MLARLFFIIATSLIIGSPANSSSRPRMAIVAIDLSSSAPAATHDGFAASSGQWVASYLRRFEYRDRIFVRTFGAYDGEQNLFQRDFVLNRNNRPDRIAGSIGRLISSLPMHIAEGRLQMQEQTNLIAFLDDMARAYPCARTRAEIVLVSDGFESSTLADAYELSRQGSGSFPAPRPGSLEGCSLTILGIGQGSPDPTRVRRLRQLWREWAEAAGADSVRLLTTW